MSGEEAQYTLAYHPANDPDPGGAPFKYRTFYLDDALADAWRIRDSGGRAETIVREQETFFDEERLQVILGRISERLSLAPDHRLREIVAQVLQETSKAKSAS